MPVKNFIRSNSYYPLLLTISWGKLIISELTTWKLSHFLIFSDDYAKILIGIGLYPRMDFAVLDLIEPALVE